MDEEIGRVKFGAAIVVATTLKILALLILTGGIILAIQGGVDLAHDETNTGQTVVTFVAAVLGSSVTSAALLGAAGFALEVLVDSYTELWEIRYSGGDSGDE